MRPVRTSPPGAGASHALARRSGASNAARSGAVRSIIEDRLIGMNRPVEPADRVPAADVAQDCAQQVRSRQVRVRQVGAGQVGPHQQHFAEGCAQEGGAREIRAARVRAHDADPAQVEAREVLPADVGRGLRRGGREGRDDLVAGEALLGGSGPRAGDPRGEARQRRRHPRAGHWLFLRSDSRCGRPGFNQPSLRAFTYWYSCFTAAVSSSTFHEGIPLSGRPFSTVYSKESRGYAIPAVLNTHRKSGAVAITGCWASSPWQRKQYTWNHFHPW